MASMTDRLNTEAMQSEVTRDIAILPAGTVVVNWVAPFDLQLTGGVVTATVAPTTAGTYTLAIQDETGAANLLGAATANLDATITANTALALTLTATAADRSLAQNDVVSFTVVSDNGDLVGEGLIVQLRYDAR
jgi:hypothetical protein